MNTMHRLAVAAAGVIAMAIAPASAIASGTDYYFGSPGNNLYWPPHPSYNSIRLSSPQNLTESSAATDNGQTVCTYSYDNYGGGLYGNPTQVVCSSTLAVKPLCGCVSRIGASRGTEYGPQPWGRARIAW